MDRIICCHSTDPCVRHDKIYRCNGCKNLWHGTCYSNYHEKNDRNGCCKDRGVGVAFPNETTLMMRNAQKSHRDRQ